MSVIVIEECDITQKHSMLEMLAESPTAFLWALQGSWELQRGHCSEQL